MVTTHLDAGDWEASPRPKHHTNATFVSILPSVKGLSKRLAARTASGGRLHLGHSAWKATALPTPILLTLVPRFNKPAKGVTHFTPG